MQTYQQGINIVGYTQAMFGLGEAIRLNIEAANKHEIPHSLINYEKVKKNKNYQYSFPYSVNLVQISLNDLESFFAVINPDFFKGRYTILFLVWESEYIAPELAENLCLFNEIWTPSEYCKSIFEKTFSGPVIIVPHPVEVDLKPIESKNSIKFFNENKFSFLFLFSYHSSIERKNPFFLIEAFKAAFEDNDNVELVIKTVGGKDYRRSKQRLQQYASNNVKIVDIELDKNQVDHLINSCDSYVSMHHSEGFGLTLAEAMYLGKPVIATNYSGNTQYMNDENSFLINYESAYIEKPDNNFCSNTLWANPLLADAVAKMKEVYENSDLRNAKANNARAYVKEKLSFFNVGLIIKERLNHLHANFAELVTNQKQNTYFLNKLQASKAENAKLQREIRRMKRNVIIYFILMLKNFIKKIKKRA